MSRVKQVLESPSREEAKGWTYPLLHAFIGTVCHFGDESQSTWGERTGGSFVSSASTALTSSLSLCVSSVSPVVGHGGVVAPVFPTKASGP